MRCLYSQTGKRVHGLGASMACRIGVNLRSSAAKAVFKLIPRTNKQGRRTTPLSFLPGVEQKLERHIAHGFAELRGIGVFALKFDAQAHIVLRVGVAQGIVVADESGLVEREQ
jgi:hypothetical protein